MSRDPFVGFGDDPNSSVKFQLVHDKGRIGDWSGGKPLMAQNKIALSSKLVTQVWGREPKEATFSLLFDRIDDYELLGELQGQRATLRILAGITKTAGGTVQTLLGTRYLVLPHTMLLRLDDEVVYLGGGHCSAKATFQRQSSDDSYYGFATYAEEEAP